jgi:hypothetical protein
VDAGPSHISQLVSELRGTAPFQQGANMANAIYPLYGEIQRINILMFGGPPLTLTGTVTSGSPTITAPSLTTGIVIGSKITGTAIPANTTVIAVDSAVPSITMSANATGNHTAETLTLQPDNAPLAGLLDGATVRLYQSALTPGQGTTLANLVAAEATFDGYAAQTLAMDTGYINGANQAVAESQLLVWTPTGSVASNSIGGAWSDDGTGAIIIWPLDAPVSLAGPTTTLKIVATDAYITPGKTIQVLP